MIEVAVPDLAIVDRDLAAAVDRELARRSTPAATKRGNGKRERHLLTGLIKCGECGSNFTISGKDYYRCAGAKERGTCSSKVAVRAGPLEEGVLVALQKQLLTADMAELFVTEFQREMIRLAKASGDTDRNTERRLQSIDAELAALSENLLAGVVGPTTMSMISEREAEREDLAAKLAARRRPLDAEVIPHPALLRRFEEKIARLREALNDKAVRGEAVATIRELVESVTINADATEGTVSADLVASADKLLRYAQNAETPSSSSRRTWSA